MKYIKIFAVIFVANIVYSLSNSHIYAAEKTSDSSAIMSYASGVGSNTQTSTDHVKRIVLTKVLSKNNSPLLSNVDTFVDVATKYNLDPYLLPSITWLESSLGTKLIERTHNPFGWVGVLIAWRNFDEGIETVAHGLRVNYINKGAKNIYDIGHIYASSPTWAIRVEKFMGEFYNEEQSVTKMRDVMGISESS